MVAIHIASSRLWPPNLEALLERITLEVGGSEFPSNMNGNIIGIIGIENIAIPIDIPIHIGSLPISYSNMTI